MNNRIITIQTHAQLKTSADQRSFNSQLLAINSKRVYVLSATEQELSDIAQGCKLYDDEAVYYVWSIFYQPSQKYAFITVR